MLRRSGVYIVNEPKDLDTTENGGPDHVYLNKMSEEGENGVATEMATEPEMIGVPVEVPPPAEPLPEQKRQKKTISTVYR